TSFVKAACVLRNYLRAAPVLFKASREDHQRKRTVYFGLRSCKERSGSRALDV
ncbi:hypothetical protein HPB47_002068, partial [Ixodes persulcatus]